MPTLTQIKLPLPKNSSEFEDVVATALGNRITETDPIRWGRSGQKQHGVDIQYTDHLARATGVQCKLVAVFTAEDLAAAVKEAENFKPALDNFFIALGLPRDARLQKAALALSTKRAGRALFRVGLLFWDDIVDDLARDPVDLARHYPDLFQSLDSTAVVAARGSLLAGDVGKERYAALQRLSALRMGCLPKSRWPDMDWHEACEIIALDLDRHAARIASLRKDFASSLPDKVEEELLAAEVAAEDGRFDFAELKLEDGVPRDSSDAAGVMYDHLAAAENQLKEFLTQHHGLRF